MIKRWFYKMNVVYDDSILGVNKSISGLVLKEDDRIAIQILVQTLIAVMQDNLIRILIYGSKARGDYNSDSDTDIFVLVKKISGEERQKIYETVLDLELEYDPRISLVIYSEYEYRKNVEMRSFFIENIEREGLEVWRSQGLS